MSLKKQGLSEDNPCCTHRDSFGEERVADKDILMSSCLSSQMPFSVEWCAKPGHAVTGNIENTIT